jgi:hypothetical protein
MVVGIVSWFGMISLQLPELIVWDNWYLAVPAGNPSVGLFPVLVQQSASTSG